MDEACPCGSAQALADCCGPFLSGAGRPATAAALMRSRYTAYCRRDAAYLLKTWHPDTRPATLDFSQDTTIWAGLNIVRQLGGGPEDSLGEVAFSAAYRQDGAARRMRENSRFAKVAGEWLYLDGAILPESKPGRNDPCICGSGKKSKKCCG
jgi:SEC-C motif-containing protein